MANKLRPERMKEEDFKILQDMMEADRIRRERRDYTYRWQGKDFVPTLKYNTIKIEDLVPTVPDRENMDLALIVYIKEAIKEAELLGRKDLVIAMKTDLRDWLMKMRHVAIRPAYNSKYGSGYELLGLPVIMDETHGEPALVYWHDGDGGMRCPVCAGDDE